MSEEAYRRLHQAIISGELARTGKLPDVYLEEERIIHPDSPDGQTFQSEMERILKNIRPGYFDSEGKLQRPVKFVLADTPEVNAYIMGPGKNPAVVCIYKGMLQECRSEDELAHVLGHEMQHDAFAITMGNGPNSLPEEMGCNLLPLNWMLEKQGDSYVYNIEAASHFSDRGAVRTSKLENLAAGTFDIHGMPVMEAESIRAAVALLHAKHRNLPQEKPLSSIMQHLAKEVHHVPYIQNLRTEHPDFDTLPITKQLELTLPALESFQTGMAVRSKDLRGVFNVMNKSPDRQTDTARELAQQAIDIVSHKNPEAFDAAYIPLQRIFFPQKSSVKSFPMTDNLREMQQKTEAFIHAKNKDEALATATELATIYDRWPKSLTLKTMPWPNFDMPGPSAMQLIISRRGEGTPWLKHVEWAKEAAAEGNWDAAKSLWMLGIAPKDLFDLASKETLATYIRGPVFGPPNERYDRFMLAPNGAIVDELARGYTQKGETEKNLGARLEALEKEAEKPADKLNAPALAPPHTVQSVGILPPLNKISGEEFYNQFAAYMQKESPRLMSPAKSGQMPQKDSFRDVFQDMDPKAQQAWRQHYDVCRDIVARMNDLLAQDPETYKPFVRAFFLENVQGYGADYFMDAEKTSIPHAYALGYPPRAQLHPFHDFVLSDPHHVFSFEERIKFVAPAAKSLPLDIVERDIEVPLSAPLPGNELKNILDQYKQAGEKVYSLQAMAGQLIVNHLKSKNHTKKSDIATLLSDYPHFFDYIASNNIEAVRVEETWRFDSKARFRAAMMSENEGLLSSWSPTSDKKKLETLRYPGATPATLLKNRDVVLKAIREENNWPEDGRTMASIYTTLDRCGLFPDDTWRKQFADKVVSTIRNVSDPQERLSIATEFISGEQIKDLQLRTQVINIWADTISTIIGSKDPGYDKEQAERYAQATDEDKPNLRTDYVRPRTEEESKQLGKSLVHVLVAYMDGTPLDKAMHQETQRVRDADPEKKSPDFLISSQRAMLALNKFREEAGNDNVVKILSSLYRSGQIDPAIKDSITKELQKNKLAIGSKMMKLKATGRLDASIAQALTDFTDSKNATKEPFVTITQDKTLQHEEPRFYHASPERDSGLKTLQKFKEKHTAHVQKPTFQINTDSSQHHEKGIEKTIKIQQKQSQAPSTSR